MKKYLSVALILTSAVVGCRSLPDADGFWEPKKSIRLIAIQTCKQWILGKLDLENHSLDEYHHAVSGFSDDSGKRYLVIQFAHKIEMKDLITEYGIEACTGGFPYYFTIDVSSDGRKVLDHYAEYE